MKSCVIRHPVKCDIHALVMIRIDRMLYTEGNLSNLTLDGTKMRWSDWAEYRVKPVLSDTL